MKLNDTIVALATPSGAGAIAVIRVSGPEALNIVAPLFKAKSKKSLDKQSTHTIHLGNVMDGARTIDEVLASVFRAPKSYTGEEILLKMK